jgi:hypothetical protein
MSVDFVQCSFDKLPIVIEGTFSCEVTVLGCGKTDRRRINNVMKVVTQFSDGWFRIKKVVI